jgi:uncharacterized protein YdeI (YjbR/CyaY-like superfamily)
MVAKKISEADIYFKEGCGRCSLGGTPTCKVHSWSKELSALRKILLKSALTEERKWGVACYTLSGKNVIMIGAFKEYCSISFFNGSLLKDPSRILQKAGANTQSARIIRFTSVAEINKLAPAIRQLIDEAVLAEQSGKKPVAYKITESDFPGELKNYLQSDPVFQKAFMSLTPGRQRGYCIYISGAKQAATRMSRIEKYREKILAGKGIMD